MSYVWRDGVLEVSLKRFKCDTYGCAEHWSIGGPFCEKCTERRLGVEIRPTENAGLGVFAKREFKAGETVCPVVAEYINEDEIEKRYPGSAIAAYALPVDRSIYADGLSVRGLYSCINGCASKEEANVVTRLSTHESQWPAEVACLKNIAVGEQLILCYGEHFQDIIRYKHQTIKSSESPGSAEILDSTLARSVVKQSNDLDTRAYEIVDAIAIRFSNENELFEKALNEQRDIQERAIEKDIAEMREKQEEECLALRVRHDAERLMLSTKHALDRTDLNDRQKCRRKQVTDKHRTIIRDMVERVQHTL